mmetsp:Transcript_59385/g.181126  ORF Transcript_59385/g.181126 Transcript_59385/m.181126 type:complete len:282 (-) Transcript_59385:95-940(-)
MVVLALLRARRPTHVHQQQVFLLIAADDPRRHPHRDVVFRARAEHLLHGVIIAEIPRVHLVHSWKPLLRRVRARRSGPDADGGHRTAGASQRLGQTHHGVGLLGGDLAHLGDGVAALDVVRVAPVRIQPRQVGARRLGQTAREAHRLLSVGVDAVPAVAAIDHEEHRPALARARRPGQHGCQHIWVVKRDVEGIQLVRQRCRPRKLVLCDGHRIEDVVKPAHRKKPSLFQRGHRDAAPGPARHDGAAFERLVRLHVRPQHAAEPSGPVHHPLRVALEDGPV